MKGESLRVKRAPYPHTLGTIRGHEEKCPGLPGTADKQRWGP